MKRKNDLNCATCPGRPHSIFCKLEGESLQLLNEQKNSNVYKKGQNLFLEGNPPFGLFCIHSGKVKVTKTTSDGKETIVRVAANGDVLGHRSLFSDSPYAATATVIEEGMICFVGKQSVNDLIKKDPSLAIQIINRLSKQMGAAEERLASMARKSIRERFAETLLLFNEAHGIKEEGRVRLDIILSREEMAAVVGAAPENIIRLITEFKDAGYIEQEKKTIYLLNIPALEEIAGIA